MYIKSVDIVLKNSGHSFSGSVIRISGLSKGLGCDMEMHYTVEVFIWCFQEDIYGKRFVINSKQIEIVHQPIVNCSLWHC
ncbi:hypothetical protein Ahy_A08g038273 isoform E [Arachis hypogaea]|uniref:Uncharacterized protein n=1 Tax=Arachis hypogaea TaxID=3818 RepID=A0A445BT22_ARAHY|nr:hypothetical protein Ahy_A08g038273 isoform E [Arachis hypogaea]